MDLTFFYRYTIESLSYNLKLVSLEIYFNLFSCVFNDRMITYRHRSQVKDPRVGQYLSWRWMHDVMSEVS